MSSQQFATTESAAVMTSDDEYESTESQASLNSKGRRQPAKETATRTDNTVLTQSFSDAVKKILSKADSLGDSHSFTGHQKIIHDFACLLEGHMQAIPESKWHEFQIDCLNLVHRYKQHQQQPMTWLAPQSQQPLPPHQQLWHLAPQQPQPHPAATWIPTLSPQFPLTRSTQLEPAMPTGPTATVVQTPPSATPVPSPAASFRTPIIFQGLGFPDCSLDDTASTNVPTHELKTPPVQQVSPGSGTCKETE